MKKPSYNVAILGATGAVGQALLSLLAERQFPLDNLYCLASARSAGKTVTFNNQSIRVQDAATFDFSQVDLGLFSAGGEISAKYAPIAVQAGCVVIDNTSHFRYETDIPLIIPEVNPQALSTYTQRNIIANPNCSTIQMLVALKPLHDRAHIRRINVATYQAVSGSGQRAMQELQNQCQQSLAGETLIHNVYPKPIAFNVIPQIDVWQDNGYTKEEMKMVWETQKILQEDSIQVNPTAVRVPVMVGHAEALHIETEDELSAAEARALLQAAPGVTVLADGQYPTPAEVAGQDDVFVGRIRKDLSHPKGLDLWVVADNVRKGAALNAIQIAEMLTR